MKKHSLSERVLEHERDARLPGAKPGWKTVRGVCITPVPALTQKRMQDYPPFKDNTMQRVQDELDLIRCCEELGKKRGSGISNRQKAWFECMDLPQLDESS